MSERGFLQRSQFMKRDLTFALDISNTEIPHETKLKLAQSLSQEILRSLGNSAEADVTLRIDMTEPTHVKSPGRRYELSLTSRGVGQEVKVRILWLNSFYL